MPAYLLDSNAISELMRNPEGPVAHAYRSKELDPDARLFISIISAAELRYGPQEKDRLLLPSA